MVVNHYKMRRDVQSYHLGGMGCANGTIAINLVKDMLQVGKWEGPPWSFMRCCVLH
jgi:hypothetical protein